MRNSGGVNNVTIDELKGENISKLFDRWQALYSKNSYPLAFFNRIDKDKLTPRQYIAGVITAFDSITDKREKNKNHDKYKNLKREIYQFFQSQFSALGLTEKNIVLAYERFDTLKRRIENAMSLMNMHFSYNEKNFDDDEVATILKNIRNSSAHGIEITPTKNIRLQHYYSLGEFCEKLLIQYIRKNVLELEGKVK